MFVGTLIGEKLRWWMDKLGVSLPVLVERSRLSENVIARILLDSLPATQLHLERIVTALGQRPEAFLQDKDAWIEQTKQNLIAYLDQRGELLMFPLAWKQLLSRLRAKGFNGREQRPLGERELRLFIAELIAEGRWLQHNASS